MLSSFIRLDLPQRHFFAIEIDDIIDTGFMACSGLRGRINTSDHKPLNAGSVMSSLIMAEADAVVLSKAYEFSESLWNWWIQCVRWQRGQPTYKRNVSILQLYPFHGVLVDIRRWNLYNAWIQSYETVEFDSSMPGVSADRVTLKFDGLPHLEYSIGQLGYGDTMAALQFLETTVGVMGAIF